MKWYVIQVRSGHEREIAEKCRAMISANLLIECFIPEYVYQKRYLGEWHEVKDILFKGYVFIISDDIDSLAVQLRGIPNFVKVIGKKKNEIYPLDDEEVAFIQSFGKTQHIVGMSTGLIKGERILVTKGPLQGKEGMIVKINRHKRIAHLSLSMFNKDITTKVGLEIISKC